MRPVSSDRTSAVEGYDLTMRVGVVIPVFNGAKFLREAVDSVLAQTHMPDEIVVVDDGSSDGSADLASQLLADVPTASVIRLVLNEGPATARNAGVNRLSTPLVAFLDADDFWHPNHLASLLAYLDKNVMLVSGIPDGPGSGSCIVPSECNEYELRDLIATNPINQSAVLVRRADLVASGGYAPSARYAEDFDLWARLLLGGGKVRVLPVPTYGRRVHERQVSQRNVESMIRAGWAVREQIIDRLGPDSCSAKSIRAALDHDLRAAWHVRSASAGRFLLNTRASHLIGSELASWRAKFGWQWPFWSAAAHVYDTLR
jgi:glycosyltransferase involved in cell wall biosynthesis